MAFPKAKLGGSAVKIIFLCALCVLGGGAWAQVKVEPGVRINSGVRFAKAESSYAAPQLKQASHGGAAYGWTQIKYPGNTASYLTAYSTTKPKSLGAVSNATGNLLLVKLWGYNSGSLPTSSASDSNSNSYTCTTAVATADVYWSRFCWAVNNATAANTISCTASAGWLQCEAEEWSGNLASPYDATAGATGTASAMSSGNLTLAGTSDLVSGLFFDSTNTTAMVVGTGWTSDFNNTTTDAALGEHKSGASGTMAATATSNAASPHWVANAIAFKGSSPNVPAVYSQAQTAGDTNVVIIGWYGSAIAPTGVSDDAGNTYALAAPANSTSDNSMPRQAIYYAKNIAAHAAGNVVNVAFDGMPAGPDLRLLEFSGLDQTAPLASSCTPSCYASASGSFLAGDNPIVATSAIASSAPALLLVVGGMSTYSFRCTGQWNTCTDYAGTDFQPAMYTQYSGDIAEYRNAIGTGSYAASAMVTNASQNWLLTMAAFVPAGQTQTPPGPVVTGISPASGTYNGGTSVTISGTNFETGATVDFGGVAAMGVTVVSSSQITATTPAHTVGAVDVTVTNLDSQVGTLSLAYTYTGQYVLTVTVGAGGGVGSTPAGIANCRGTCTASFDSGTEVQLSETPDSGYSFSSWGGDCSGAGNCAVSMTQDRSVTATFTNGNVIHYYVGGSGSDLRTEAQARNPATPWATMLHASQALVLGPAGTVVHVLPGTYSYASYVNLARSGTATQRITYQSDTKAFDGTSTHTGAAIFSMTCGQSICVNQTGDYVDMVGFEVTGPNSGGLGIGTNVGQGSPSTCNTDGIDTPTGCGFGLYNKVLNNYIHDIGQTKSDCAYGPALYIGSGNHNTLVDANLIRRNGKWGAGCENGYALYLAGYRNTVTNNILADSTLGVHLYHNSCENVISNNTIAHNYWGGIMVGGWTSGTIGTPYCAIAPRTGTDYVAIDNNVLVRNGWGCGAAGRGAYPIQFYNTAGNGGAATHNVVAHNYFAGNFDSTCAVNNTTQLSGASAPTRSDNLHETDALASYGNLFVSYADDGTGNYHLLSGSPLREVGAQSTSSDCAAAPRGVTPCIPGKDAEGTVRPQSSGYDISAYEYH